MQLVDLVTFEHLYQAHLLQAKLESEGIESFLFNEHTINIEPILSNALGGIRLKVKAKDLEQALVVCESIRQQRLEKNEQAILCPNCDSTDIDLDYISLKSFKAIASFIVSFVLLIFPFYFKRLCKCNSCGLEFKYELDS